MVVTMPTRPRVSPVLAPKSLERLPTIKTRTVLIPLHRDGLTPLFPTPLRTVLCKRRAKWPTVDIGIILRQLAVRRRVVNTLRIKVLGLLSSRRVLCTPL